MNSLFGLSMNTIMIVLVILLALSVSISLLVFLRNRIIFMIGLRNIPRRVAQTVLIVIGLMLSTVIITATSVADTSVTATATVTVVTATTPTVTSVSPNTTALGGLFQDIYITGTNFISTENVYVNEAPLASTFVTDVSSSVIRARIPDFILAAPPQSNKLVIKVSEQSGTRQTCADASLCEVTVMAVRPGVAGPSPDSIPQGTAGVLSFNVDGGFFGIPVYLRIKKILK